MADEVGVEAIRDAVNEADSKKDEVATAVEEAVEALNEMVESIRSVAGTSSSEIPREAIKGLEEAANKITEGFKEAETALQKAKQYADEYV